NVSTRHTAPARSIHSAPDRTATSRGVITPLAARCSVTAAISSFTAAGKIGFTRCSTSGSPLAARTNHVGLINPDVARRTGSRASPNASSTSPSGTSWESSLTAEDDTRAVAAAPTSRSQSDCQPPPSELDVELRQDPAGALRALVVAEHAVAAQPI